MNINESCDRKSKDYPLSEDAYYEAIRYLTKYGENNLSAKFFVALNSFGMTRKEVLYLTKAIRDSGKVLKHNDRILEKHSTGGIADSTSMVLIPLLASMGYKMIKTTGKSFLYTNGSADKFGAIPGFKVSLKDADIEAMLDTCNACVLAHGGDICPADKTLFKIREKYNLGSDINILAASIASKKLASGAGVVLVDVKYGEASVVKTYKEAVRLTDLLKYIFKQSGVKCVIVITNTLQTIGEAVGNVLEVVDALNILQGKKGLLRDISIQYAVELMLKVDPKLNRKDAFDMAEHAIDNKNAYKQFLKIVGQQGGDYGLLAHAKLFIPVKSTNFLSHAEGYVGNIDSLALGDIVSKLTKATKNSNVGIVLRVKIGDYLKEGDPIVSFYYVNDSDLNKYKDAILGCVRISHQKFEKINTIKRIIR